MSNLPSRRQKFLAFDPNGAQRDPWATFVIGRRPEFKAHTNRRLALSAMNRHPNLAALYEWNPSDHKWEERARKDREGHGSTCDYCGGTTIERRAHQWYTNFTVRARSAIPLAPWYAVPVGNHDLQSDTGNYDCGRYVWMRHHRKLVEPLQLLYVCENDLPVFRA